MKKLHLFTETLQERAGLPKSFLVHERCSWMQEKKAMCAHWAKDAFGEGRVKQSSCFLVWPRQYGVTWHQNSAYRSSIWFSLLHESTHKHSLFTWKGSNEGSMLQKEEGAPGVVTRGRFLRISQRHHRERGRKKRRRRRMLREEKHDGQICINLKRGEVISQLAKHFW